MNADDLIREQAPKYFFTVTDTLDEDVTVTFVDQAYWNKYYDVPDEFPNDDLITALAGLDLHVAFGATFEDGAERTPIYLEEYLESFGFVYSDDLERYLEDTYGDYGDDDDFDDLDDLDDDFEFDDDEDALDALEDDY